VTSPSQTASTVTDSGGHFTFASLAPDDYAVSRRKPATTKHRTPAPSSCRRDASAHRDDAQAAQDDRDTTSRSSSSLVRPGTTSTSIRSTPPSKRAPASGWRRHAQQRVFGDFRRTGAYVPTNQAGYNLAIHIRGGDSSEVGYELDGIPMNRASTANVELRLVARQRNCKSTPARRGDSEGQGLRASSIRSSRAARIRATGRGRDVRQPDLLS